MRHIKLLFSGIILLFITSVSAEDISLYQVTPCMLLPWVVYISIALEYKHCISFTFFIGLAADLLNPQLLGFSAILLVLLSHFVHEHNARFNKDKYSAILFSLFVINVLYYAAQWGYFAISSPEPMFLLQKTLLTIVYNTLISCLVIFLLFLIDKLRISISE